MSNLNFFRVLTKNGSNTEAVQYPLSHFRRSPTTDSTVSSSADFRVNQHNSYLNYISGSTKHGFAMLNVAGYANDIYVANYGRFVGSSNELRIEQFISTGSFSYGLNMAVDDVKRIQHVDTFTISQTNLQTLAGGVGGTLEGIFIDYASSRFSDGGSVRHGASRFLYIAHSSLGSIYITQIPITGSLILPPNGDSNGRYVAISTVQTASTSEYNPNTNLVKTIRVGSDTNGLSAFRGFTVGGRYESGSISTPYREYIKSIYTYVKTGTSYNDAFINKIPVTFSFNDNPFQDNRYLYADFMYSGALHNMPNAIANSSSLQIYNTSSLLDDTHHINLQLNSVDTKYDEKNQFGSNDIYLYTSDDKPSVWIYQDTSSGSAAHPLISQSQQTYNSNWDPYPSSSEYGYVVAIEPQGEDTVQRVAFANISGSNPRIDRSITMSFFEHSTLHFSFEPK